MFDRIQEIEAVYKEVRSQNATVINELESEVTRLKELVSNLEAQLKYERVGFESALKSVIEVTLKCKSNE